jgi:hypothetical protein
MRRSLTICLLLGLSASAGCQSEAQRPAPGLAPNVLHCNEYIISLAKPVYPEHATKRSLEGWVALAYDLHNKGRAINIRVMDGEPMDEFVGSATAALAQSRFKEGVDETNCAIVITYTLSHP